MNVGNVLTRVRELILPRLSEGNPLRGAFFLEVADAKAPEQLRTCAVLQVSYSQARELIPGNFTWQYPCRCWARFYPPQGDWRAEQMRGWMEEAGLAVVGALGALMAVPVVEQQAQGAVVLDAVCTGGVSWQADAEAGYIGEVPFMLTIQF